MRSFAILIILTAAATGVIVSSHDVPNLCGHTCVEVFPNKSPCPAVWEDGCKGIAPPEGFKADSTGYDLCPSVCTKPTPHSKPEHVKDRDKHPATKQVKRVPSRGKGDAHSGGDVANLCGHSCKSVFPKISPCTAVWKDGCREPPPAGFEADSTGYDLCPSVCTKPTPHSKPEHVKDRDTHQTDTHHTDKHAATKQVKRVPSRGKGDAHSGGDVANLCGHSCAEVFPKKIFCAAMWRDGCSGHAAPAGFTAESTGFDLCPSVCNRGAVYEVQRGHHVRCRKSDLIAGTTPRGVAGKTQFNNLGVQHTEADCGAACFGNERCVWAAWDHTSQHCHGFSSCVTISVKQKMTLMRMTRPLKRQPGQPFPEWANANAIAQLLGKRVERAVTGLLIYVAVMSPPENFGKRLIFRSDCVSKLWGLMKNVQLVYHFVIGRPSGLKNPNNLRSDRSKDEMEVSRKLWQERSRYGDIYVATTRDIQKESSSKLLEGLRIGVEMGATYIVKTNDDTCLDTSKFMSAIADHGKPYLAYIGSKTRQKFNKKIAGINTGVDGRFLRYMDGPAYALSFGVAHHIVSEDRDHSALFSIYSNTNENVNLGRWVAYASQTHKLNTQLIVIDGMTRSLDDHRD